MGDALPSRFGTRFEVLRRVGEGAMGVVYEVRDQRVDGRLALKVLRSFEYAAQSRFKREFRALQGIHHPNLITLHELFEHGEHLFFTMDLVEGVDFVTHVRGHGGRPLVEQATLEFSDRSGTIDLAARAAPRAEPAIDAGRLRTALSGLIHAVAALHQNELIHRDIKPSNVLVEGSGRTRLLDFGLVLASRDYASTAEHVVGTAHYMSPEQAGGDALGPASDLYSVGVVLFEALTGSLPFHGNPIEVMTHKRMFDAPAASALASDVPADLERLCAALLKRAPRERPSAAWVAQQLPPAEPVHPSAQLSTRPSQRVLRPFFGRSHERRWLQRQFDEARRAGPIAGFVRGESGVGKSELVRRFISELREAQPELVSLGGRCFEHESVHYKGIDGIVEALSVFLQRLPREQAGALVPRHRDALVQQFPALAKVSVLACGAGVPSGEAWRERAYAIDALRELLLRVSDRAPLLLSIDDMQWMDADGWGVLEGLLRGADGPRMLFVGIFSMQARDAPPARLRSIACRREVLELGRLSREATRELAADYAAREGVACGDIDRLADEAQGHPVFLGELIRHVGTHASSADGVPPSLDEALFKRVSLLEPSERGLIELTAIVEAPVPLGLASAVLDVPSEVLRRQVRRLRAERLLSAGQGAEDPLQLWHERVRRAVLGRLGAQQQARWHRRVASALEQVEPCDCEALARHWSAGKEPARAARYAIQAGERAAAAFAFDRAASLFRFALAHVYGERERRRVSVALGATLSDAGRGHEAAQVLLATAELAPHSEERLELRHRAARELLRSGYIEEGLKALEVVLNSVGMRFPTTPLEALGSLVLNRARLRVRGLRYIVRPEPAVDDLLLRRLDICWSIGSGLALVDIVRSADFQTRTLLLALEAGEPVRLSRALAMEAAVASAEGAKGRRRVQELLHMAEGLSGTNDRSRGAWLLLARAAVAIQEGHFEDCLRFASTAEASLRDGCPGAAWELASAQAFGVWSLAYLGRLRELGEKVPALLRDCKERGDRFAAMNLVNGPVYLHYLARDEVGSMLAASAEGLRSWTHDGFHYQHLAALFTCTSADLYEGRWDSARQRVEAAWPLLERSLLLRIQQFRLDAWWLRGRVWMAPEGGNAAPRMLKAAIKRIEIENMAWSVGHALALRAGLACLEGDRQTADRLLFSAAQAYDVSRMGVHAAACRVQRAKTSRASGEDDAARGWQALLDQGVVAPERLATALWPAGGG